MKQDIVNFDQPYDEPISSGIEGLLNLDNPITVTFDSSSIDTSDKKKRGRPKKKQLSDGTVMVVDNELKPYQTNEPYMSSYDETNNMLKTAVMQIDSTSAQINEELAKIRSSSTLRNKYKYITDMTMTTATLINTKVSVARELNKTITDCHNLELKRIKELNLNATTEKNDDKYIMDMYNAFIRTPVGAYGSQPMPMPNSADLTNPMMGGVDIYGANENGYDYTSYINNLSPGQQTMRYETNGNIKTVVVYDASTGYRHFATMDISTGQYLPDNNLPDPMFVEDLTISVKQANAYNSNLGLSYPLIIINGDNTMNEF